MRRRMLAAVIGILSLGAGAAVASTYTNPVWGQDFADPYVLRAPDGGWYAYSTASAAGNLPVLRSADLAAWEPAGDAMPDLAAWVGPGRNWAPAVLAVGGRYVAYYTALNARAGHQCIGVAVADAPTGPFVDRSEAPFVCQLDRAGSIDPSPFRDAGGRLWLAWKSEGHFPGRPATIWTQRLGEDATTLLGAPSPVLTADQPWERGVVEAPSMIAHHGVHYLFYSASTWDSADYAVSYAVCDGPAGPCRKPSPWPLMIRSAEVGGPGGQEVFVDADGAVWMAYHAWTMPAVGYPSGTRSLRLERVHFVDGRPVVNGPTTGAATLRRAFRLAGADRYATAAALSARTFDPGVPVAYVASGESFADALAAAPAAGTAGGPVLLVNSLRVPSSTAAELERLRPRHVVVVGAVGMRPDIVAALRSISGAHVTTVVGRDRYETAAAVSYAAFRGPVDVAYVATGRSFPDALAAGAAGARRQGPVLLVDRGLPSKVAAELSRLQPREIVVIGGRAAVDDGVVRDLAALGRPVRRLAGADRYDTAAAVSRATYPGLEPDVLVATGEGFADALTAGAARRPLLLVHRGVPLSVTVELARLAGTVTVLGGEVAVPQSALGQLDLR